LSESARCRENTDEQGQREMWEEPTHRKGKRKRE
jgi:hypothetical protein